MKTCPTGKCQTSTNKNRGAFIVKCSNEKCDYTRPTQPVNIDRWNIDAQYRHQVDNCPKCDNILYLTPHARKKPNAHAPTTQTTVQGIFTRQPKKPSLQRITQKVNPTGANN